MKRILLITLFVFVFNVNADEEINLYEKNILLKTTSHFVHRRFYYVERLRKTMRLLARINAKLLQLDFLLYRRISEYNFTHARIKGSIDEILRTKSLKPLFMVWDDFSSYKSLEDDIFVEEFTREIFIITRNALVHGFPVNRSNDLLLSLIKNCDLGTCNSPEMVEYIDIMASYIEAFSNNMKPGEFLLYKTRNLKDEFVDLSSRIESERILLRFYLTERLREVIKETLKNKKVKGFDTIVKRSFAQGINFNNKYITMYVDRINEKGSIDPVFYIWKDLKQYKFISHNEFEREAVMVFFIVCKDVFLQTLKRKKENELEITATQVLELYKKIESLPIEEMLKAIDLLSSGIITLLQSNSSGESTWGVLMQKYWWLKPLIALGISFKIISYYMPSLPTSK